MTADEGEITSQQESKTGRISIRMARGVYGQPLPKFWRWHCPCCPVISYVTPRDACFHDVAQHINQWHLDESVSTHNTGDTT
jgi:hypothetical protein